MLIACFLSLGNKKATNHNIFDNTGGSFRICLWGTEGNWLYSKLDFEFLWAPPPNIFISPSNFPIICCSFDFKILSASLSHKMIRLFSVTRHRRPVSSIGRISDDRAVGSRNSFLLTILRAVKEPMHYSKRVGYDVPGVVVWPCCGWIPSTGITSCILHSIQFVLGKIVTVLPQLSWGSQLFLHFLTKLDEPFTWEAVGHKKKWESFSPLPRFHHFDYSSSRRKRRLGTSSNSLGLAQIRLPEVSL